MPFILVRLQTEQGQLVAEVDDRGVIAPLAALAENDSSFVCWRFIREYEDTYFSAAQMNDFIAELERLRPHAGGEGQAALDSIRTAAERCQAENLCMRLIGD